MAIAKKEKEKKKYAGGPKRRGYLNKIARNGKLKYFKYFNSNIVSQYIINKTFEFKTEKTFWEK